MMWSVHVISKDRVSAMGRRQMKCAPRVKRIMCHSAHFGVGLGGFNRVDVKATGSGASVPRLGRAFPMGSANNPHSSRKIKLLHLHKRGVNSCELAR